MSNHRSGGIAIDFKKSLTKIVHPLNTGCPFVFWFKING